MRKLTPSRRKWLFLRQRRVHRRRSRRQDYEIGTLTTDNGTILARLGKRATPPPANLCFDENFEETSAFLERVRSRTILIARGGSVFPTTKHRSKLPLLKSYHDFSGIRRVSTSAALVLASIYDVRRVFSQVNLFAVKLNEWDPAVRQTMRELGFFNLLGIESSVPEERSETRITSRFRAGVKVDPRGVDGSESVLERMFTFLGGAEAHKVPLFTAIMEAMNNVKDHAYPEHYFRHRRHIKNWWFTASADSLSGRLLVSFYDQGISIPVSLPRTRGLQRLTAAIMEQLGLDYDANDIRMDGPAIEAAMRILATATGEPNRGFGLAKIRDMVAQLPGGKLRIISRHGEYVAEAGHPPAVSFRHNPLQGTLVEIEASFAR